MKFEDILPALRTGDFTFRRDQWGKDDFVIFSGISDITEATHKTRLENNNNVFKKEPRVMRKGIVAVPKQRYVYTDNTRSDWLATAEIIPKDIVIQESDTKLWKVCDGKSKYRDLPYFFMQASHFLKICDGVATAYAFTTEDILADDWEQIDVIQRNLGRSNGWSGYTSE